MATPNCLRGPDSKPWVPWIASEGSQDQRIAGATPALVGPRISKSPGSHPTRTQEARSTCATLATDSPYGVLFMCGWLPGGFAVVRNRGTGTLPAANAVGPDSGLAGSNPALGQLPLDTTKGRGSPARIVMVRLERTDSYPEPNGGPETASSAREDRSETRVQSVVEPEVMRAAGRDRSLLNNAEKAKVPGGPASGDSRPSPRTPPLIPSPGRFGGWRHASQVRTGPSPRGRWKSTRRCPGAPGPGSRTRTTGGSIGEGRTMTTDHSREPTFSFDDFWYRGDEVACTGDKQCQAAFHDAGCPRIRPAAQHWFENGGGKP